MICPITITLTKKLQTVSIKCSKEVYFGTNFKIFLTFPSEWGNLSKSGFDSFMFYLILDWRKTVAFRKDYSWKYIISIKPSSWLGSTGSQGASHHCCSSSKLGCTLCQQGQEQGQWFHYHDEKSNSFHGHPCKRKLQCFLLVCFSNPYKLVWNTVVYLKTPLSYYYPVTLHLQA